MFLFLAVLTSLSALTMLLAGLLSYFRNPRKREHQWFFALTIALGIWVPTNFFDSNLTQQPLVSILVKLDFCFALIMGWLFVQFARALIKAMNLPVSRWTLELTKGNIFLFGSTLVNVALIVVILLGQVVQSTIARGDSLVVSTKPDFWIYVGVVGLYFCYALLSLAHAYINLRQQERAKIELIFMGFSVAILANIATNLIFPNVFSERSVVRDLNIIGYVGLVVMVVCVSFAITLRKLFDIRFFVVRAAAYASSVILLSTLYIVPSILLVAWIMHIQFTWSRFWAGVGVALVAAIFYGSVRDRFDKFTNRIFFRGYYEPQDVLDELSSLLVRATDVDRLQEKSQKILLRAIHTRYFQYWLSDADPGMSNKLAGLFRTQSNSNLLIIDELSIQQELAQELHDDNIAVVVRLRTTHGSLGFITLGFKESGELYNERDKRLLSIAADEIAISLQNALHFEEIQDFNRTLQAKVADATKELRRNNEKLKALDETKDDFISMASHQLRTPLTSVKGYLSMVLEGDAGKISPVQRKMLGQAYISSQRMVYMIADLLNVSRLKTGKFVIEPSPTDLSTMVQEEIEQLVETAQSREIALSYDKPAAFPQLMLDETKTRQVVMNFIDNAIYYTPPGGHIRVELFDKPAAVELRVTDDGIGVPKGEQHHLFTKFYRAGNARKARPDGTGLGLFMAKKVVMAQGGAIIFDSQEGKGSTFGFSFPKARLRAPTKIEPQTEKTAALAN